MLSYPACVAFQEFHSLLASSPERFNTFLETSVFALLRFFKGFQITLTSFLLCVSLRNQWAGMKIISDSQYSVILENMEAFTVKKR